MGAFLGRIEGSDPPFRALGITDYFSTATYEQAVAYKRAGRMAGVDLIFPNVELRLGIGTDRGSAINIHLLVSPEDPDHLARLHASLSDLRFEALGSRYEYEQLEKRCSCHCVYHGSVDGGRPVDSCIG